MNLKTKMMGAALALMFTSQTALAAGANNTDDFNSFYTTVKGWTGGALGLGLATTMLLMGGAIGVAQNSPMPALSGIAGAAFLHWGPEIIENIMTAGAVV